MAWRSKTVAASSRSRAAARNFSSYVRFSVLLLAGCVGLILSGEVAGGVAGLILVPLALGLLYLDKRKLDALERARLGDRSDDTSGGLGVHEYLIYTRDYDADGFRFPKLSPEGGISALTPPAQFGHADFEAESLQFVIGETVVEFSAEMPGYQITVSGPMGVEEADRIVAALTSQVAEDCGEPCDWLRLSDDDRPVSVPW